MRPFTQIDAVAVPLDIDNVDTDQLVPARFLTRPRTESFPKIAFHDVRRDKDGNLKPDFPLNMAVYRDAEIIVAGSIFGSGSSRESAVWSLADQDPETRPSGFRAVIAASFGDIFFNNCCKNGVVPIQLPAEVCRSIRERLHAAPGSRIAVDLPSQEVRLPDGTTHRFELDEFRKTCLIRGLDDISLTLSLSAEFDAFEATYYAAHPWLRG